MRILIHAASSVFPYYDGASLRTFHVVPYLAKRHILDLIQERWPWEKKTKPLSPPNIPNDWLTNHFSNIWNIWHKPGEKLRYGMIWESSELYSTLNKILSENKYDVIWAPGEAFPLYAKVCNRYDLPVITGSTDSMHLQYWRAIRMSRNLYNLSKLLAKWFLFTVYQLRVLNRMPHLLMVAERDASNIRCLSPYSDIRVIPYGVDIDYYAPPEQNSRDPFLLIFVGTLGNLSTNELALEWFIRKVWDKVISVVPQARLEIIGRDPSPQLQELSSRTDGIVLKGYVPDIREYLWKAGIFVLPMRSGGGIKNKLLEAWASKCAVVSTTLGVEGVAEARPDNNLLVADDPDVMAGYITELLYNPNLISKYGDAGRFTVEQKYRWEAITEQLEAYLCEVANKKK